MTCLLTMFAIAMQISYQEAFEGLLYTRHRVQLLQHICDSRGAVLCACKAFAEKNGLWKLLSQAASILQYVLMPIYHYTIEHA